MENKTSIPIEFITALMCLNLKEEEDRFSQEVANAINHSPVFIKYIEDFREQKDINPNRFNTMFGQLSSVGIPDIDIKAERLSRKLKTLKEQEKLKKWLSGQLPKEIEYRKSKEYRQKLQLLKKRADKILEVKQWVDKRLTINDIHKIRRRFKLSEAWDFPLVQYILTGRMRKPSARCNLSSIGLPRHKRQLFISCTWDASIDDIRNIWGTVKETQKLLPDLNNKNPIVFIDDNQNLKIELFKNTTIENIRQNWSIIEKNQRFLPEWKFKSYRYKKKFKRDTEWYRLHSEGKKEKEIYNSATDTVNPEAIRKTIERYRKRMIK